MKYFLEVAYRGTDFHGFQVQPEVRTVQGEINMALERVLRMEPPKTVGSGRTDTGVHCRRQFLQFRTDREITDKTEFLFRMNRCLHSAILIADIRKVKPEADARFSATSRAYEYRINREKDPFLPKLAYVYNYRPEVEKMHRAAQILLNYTDFESFSKVKTDVKTFLCDIEYAEWTEVDGGLIFRVKANRFLRGMVRTLVGTLLDVGRGKITENDFEKIILGKDRRLAGRAVPPQGLYLMNAEYPEEIFLSWDEKE